MTLVAPVRGPRYMVHRCIDWLLEKFANWIYLWKNTELNKCFPFCEEPARTELLPLIHLDILPFSQTGLHI